MSRLVGKCQADAVIVGGGLSGLLTGAGLSAAGMTVAVVSASASAEMPMTCASMLYEAALLQRVLRIHGQATALEHAQCLQSQLHALHASTQPYVQDMPCYLYTLSSRERSALQALQDLSCQLHLPVSIAADAGGCPFPVELSLQSPGVMINIALWKEALRASIRRRGGILFTGSRVISLDAAGVSTHQGRVVAPMIILATGKPLGLRDRRLLALLETRMVAHCRVTLPYPMHSCQQALSEGAMSLLPMADSAIATWDTGRAGSIHQRKQVRQFGDVLARRLPDSALDDLLCREIILPADGLPVIGQLPGCTTYILSGCCSALGAMHAAEVLTRRILGRFAAQDARYSPDRALPDQFLRPLLRRETARRMGHFLCRSAPACAHCGCRMRYMTAFERWACPCCGAAYDMFGQVLSAPGIHPAQLSVLQRPDI